MVQRRSLRMNLREAIGKSSCGMEIIMHPSDEQVDYVRKIKMADEMWDYLCKIHQPTDGTTKIFSFPTLMNLQMKGEQIDSFLLKWQKQLDANYNMLFLFNIVL